jgi:hypothetical protein
LGIEGLRHQNSIFDEALAKGVHFVILNEVKDLKLLKTRDASLRSE